MSKSEVMVMFLKKLSNVRSLSIRYIDDSLIDVIVKHCNILTKINADFRQISDTKRKTFVEKFGSQLVSISGVDTDMQWIHNSFPKIREIVNLEGLRMGPSIHDLAYLRLKNLKKISLHLNDEYKTLIASYDQMFRQFQQFIDNHKDLAHLEITLDLGDQSLHFVFKQVSKLNQLISLRIFYLKLINGFDIQLINGIKQMVDNCLNMKSLSMNLRLIPSNAISVMTEIKRFRRLKRLSLVFSGLYEDMTSISLFDGFRSLTHLSLFLYSSNGIDTHLLRNVDKYLPNFQTLKINGYSFTATEEMNLNQLNNPLIETKIRNNCKKISSIRLRQPFRCEIPITYGRRRCNLVTGSVIRVPRSKKYPKKLNFFTKICSYFRKYTC